MASALKDIGKTLGIVTLLAAGFTWFGVYGTGGSLKLRFLMWFVTMLVGSVASYWVVPFVFQTHMKTSHPALRLVAAAADTCQSGTAMMRACIDARLPVWHSVVRIPRDGPPRLVRRAALTVYD